MIQNALTVIVPIKPGEVQNLRNLLTEIGDNIEKNIHLSWKESPSTHFARFVILAPPSPSDPAGQNIPSLLGYPPRLLFTSNYDGTFEDYMRELVEKFGADMENIWIKCQGYPAEAAKDPAKFTKFIYENSHLKSNAPPEAFYVACRGVSVQEMSQSTALCAAFNKLLDLPETQQLGHRAPALPRKSPVACAASPAPPSGLSGLINKWVWQAIFNLAEWVIGIRDGLNPNLPVTSPEMQLVVEDRVTQNQMTVIVPIRKDLKARILLPLVLKLINSVGGKTTGSLSGLTTIHFARWAIIDGGKNLFFESNYDGSWENYIDDFVDRAHFSMNIIWGNCENFPRGGCKDIEWFKKYIRDNQIPAQVFYSAYRNSSIKNNLNDLQVARALRRVLSPGDIESLLAGSYRLTQSTLEQLMSEPFLGLFLSGSYNRGVVLALNTPAQTDPEDSGTEEAKSAAPEPDPKSAGAKKLALPLLMIAGVSLLLLKLARRRNR
jgi:hypothetical protein